MPSVETGGRGDTPADDPHPTSGASTPPNQPGKTKRTLTPDNFLTTVANVVASGPVLVEAVVRPKISAALREKLFLAVTSVNDCRYCKWGHTHWAMAQGVPLEEVNQILGHQIESLEAKNPAEAAAILFAQHYAEHLDQFDPEAIENLRKYYSEAEVAEILAYVRFHHTRQPDRQHRGCHSRPLPAMATPAVCSKQWWLRPPFLWHSTPVTDIRSLVA